MEVVHRRLQEGALRNSLPADRPLILVGHSIGGIAFELWVLPASALRQPPLEPLEDRPMRRATASVSQEWEHMAAALSEVTKH